MIMSRLFAIVKASKLLRCRGNACTVVSNVTMLTGTAFWDAQQIVSLRKRVLNQEKNAESKPHRLGDDDLHLKNMTHRITPRKTSAVKG